MSNIRIFKLKSEIIVDVIELRESYSNELKSKIIDNLKQLSKFYKVPLKLSRNNNNLKVSFVNFILNDRGYLNTLNPFYNAIVNHHEKI